MFKATDFFSGVGGISYGLQIAGFEVTGIDIEFQPDYIGDYFVQSDAIKYAYDHDCDCIVHLGSPPCQHDCMLTAGTNAGLYEYPDLLEPTLKAFQSSNKPWIIEQPPGKATSRMRELLRSPDLTLCGEMFGLGVIRHRNFWIEGFDIPKIDHIPHRGRVSGMRHGQWYEGPYFAVYGEGGGKGTVAQWQVAMDIDWTENRKSIAEAIPPAYSQYIGEEIMGQL